MQKKNTIDTHTLDIPFAVQESWQKSIDLIAKLAKIPAALVMRVHHKEIEVFRTSNSSGNPYEKGELASLGTGLYCETVMQERTRLLIPNALTDPSWHQNPDIKLNMIAYIGFPIIWPDGSVFGTICMLDNKTNTFSDDQSDLLFQFKELIEFSLRSIYKQALLDMSINDNKELECERRTLESLATTDSLTGLYNRRAFSNLAIQLFENLASENGQAAIFAIDLDKFKSINDNYGHAIGDKALRHASDTLADLSRRVDILARFGGDEFVMLAPVQTPEVAKTIAKRLVNTMRNSPLRIDEQDISITISVGFYIAAPSKINVPLALEKADFALLEAKKSGRDRFIEECDELIKLPHTI